MLRIKKIAEAFGTTAIELGTQGAAALRDIGAGNEKYYHTDYSRDCFNKCKKLAHSSPIDVNK